MKKLASAQTEFLSNTKYSCASPMSTSNVALSYLLRRYAKRERQRCGGRRTRPTKYSRIRILRTLDYAYIQYPRFHWGCVREKAPAAATSRARWRSQHTKRALRVERAPAPRARRAKASSPLPAITESPPSSPLVPVTMPLLFPPLLSPPPKCSLSRRLPQRSLATRRLHPPRQHRLRHRHRHASSR